MTTTYTNITLIDVEQSEAGEWLAENGHIAAVSPTVDDITVIYDTVLDANADAEEPLEELLKVASEISYELGCMAWLMIIGDDTVMIYSFYSDGNLIDSYGAPANEAPDGGNAEVLANAYDLPKRAIKTIRTLLNREMASATQRHEQLLAALETPKLALKASYATIKAGTLPEGIDNLDDVIFIEPETDDESDS